MQLPHLRAGRPTKGAFARSPAADALHGEGEDRVGSRRLAVGRGGLDCPRVHARLEVPERLLRALHVRLDQVGDLHHALALVLEDAALAVAAPLLQQVADHLVVDLEEGDLDLEAAVLRRRRVVALAAARAARRLRGPGLDALEDLRDGAEEDAALLLLAAAEHRVGLAGAGRTVDEDRRAAALHHGLRHQWRTAPVVDLALRRAGSEDAVEGALLHAALLGAQVLVPAGALVLADGDGSRARNLDDAVLAGRQGPDAHGDADVLSSRRPRDGRLVHVELGGA
mmetsp:Transcript_18512/g.40740  ORF Transcript_18512/g.40740 Transcript_18512/m.40740 type:complete len:283 (-) Transcript_18512:177-1025(-)